MKMKIRRMKRKIRKTMKSAKWRVEEISKRTTTQAHDDMTWCAQDTLSQCHVRHWNVCCETRENVTCEGVLFTLPVGRSRLLSTWVVVHKQVSLFLLPSIHQISTLGKTSSCQHSTLSNLMSQRLKQVAPFFDAAHSMSSEVIDIL